MRTIARLKLRAPARCSFRETFPARLEARTPFPVALGFIIVTAWLALARIHAQSPADARFEAIASLAESKMREYHVPGVAHTVFPIASISKTFTATMMMRLIEQGKVDLRAPVRTYLPDFHVQDETISRDVTIWNLLTHTAACDGQVAGP